MTQIKACLAYAYQKSGSVCV